MKKNESMSLLSFCVRKKYLRAIANFRREIKHRFLRSRPHIRGALRYSISVTLTEIHGV